VGKVAVHDHDNVSTCRLDACKYRRAKAKLGRPAYDFDVELAFLSISACDVAGSDRRIVVDDNYLGGNIGRKRLSYRVF
jgi:hypothetical protein